KSSRLPIGVPTIRRRPFERSGIAPQNSTSCLRDRFIGSSAHLPLVEPRSTDGPMNRWTDWLSSVAMPFVSALLLTASLAQGVIVDRIAVTVDDEAITESDVRKAIATSPLRPAPDESPEAFRTRVLDALI